MGEKVYFDEVRPAAIAADFEVFEMHDDGRRRWVELKSWREFLAWARSGPGRLHLIGMTMRPGVRLFSSELETRYYWPPGSPRNALLTLHEANWEEMSWVIVSIPRGHRRFAERAAARVGLRIADGIPHIFAHATSPRVFPLRGDDAWTLEYPSGSPIGPVASDPIGRALARHAEEERIKANSGRARRASQDN